MSNPFLLGIFFFIILFGNRKALVCERKFSTKVEKWCVPSVPLYVNFDTVDRVVFGLSNGVPQVISLTKNLPLITMNQADAHVSSITQIRQLDGTAFIMTISKLDSKFKIWNAVTGSLERTFSINTGAMNFVYAPKQKQVWIGYDTKEIKIYNYDNGGEVSTLGALHDGNIATMELLLADTTRPDYSMYIYTTDDTKKFYMWKIDPSGIIGYQSLKASTTFSFAGNIYNTRKIFFASASEFFVTSIRTRGP